MARTRTRSITDQNAEQKTAAGSGDSKQPAPQKKRPAPSQRKGKGGSPGIISRIPVVRSVVGYFSDVIAEMQKVTWPSREETSRLTSVVLAVTVAFAIGLGVLDTFFSWWFRQAFHPDSEWIFLAVAAGVAVALSGGFLALRHRI